MKEIWHTCISLQHLTALSRKAATGPEIAIVLFLHETSRQKPSDVSGVFVKSGFCNEILIALSLEG